jgi:hypothetical protein
MNTRATVVAVVLGFLTAWSAGQLGLLVIDGGTLRMQSVGTASESERVAMDFYEGVNRWIVTADPTLERTIASDFVDHSASSSPNCGPAELLDYLRQVGNLAPSLQFEVLSVESASSFVSVELLGSVPSGPSIAGWTLSLPEQPSFHEILRIQDDQVIERWSSDDLWPSVAARLEYQLPVSYELARQPSIQRFILDDDGEGDLSASGKVLVSVESGSLMLDLAGADPSGALRYPTEPLGTSEVRLVNTLRELHVRALGGERVAFWTVSLDPILIAGRANTPSRESIRQDASVSLGANLPGSIRIAFSVVTLPEGATISTGPNSLQAVALIDGVIQATPLSGALSFCFDVARFRLATAGELAAAGQGFINQRGSSASYLVAGSGPATLILLSIRSAAAPSDLPIHTGSA